MLDYVSHLYLPGAMTLWCAVFFGVASLWGYSQNMQGDVTALRFARRGYLFFALSVVFCAVVLFMCLARRDFRIEYVQQYSGLDLPFHYQIASFWAGQKGSFLIWLVWGTLLGIPLSRTAGKDEPGVMYVYLLTLFGLLFILVRENPFVMLSEAPLDGTGLNPLLQDDWMVIHPPIMFIGYASAAIPFSFAVAAMWSGNTKRWATRAFPWALGGFLVLGTAILMGGYWAYKTLGWGGYWGWDPVENASLIPWLIGTVLIHGLYLERTRGRYRRLNLLLSCLLFLSVLYGTFLTRSGVLADFSVHSFVDLGISGLLLFYMGFFAVVSIVALAFRLPKTETKTNEDPLLSRGFFLVMSTVIVTISALVITIGTSAPLLTSFMENPGQVGPAFYNRVNTPLAFLIVFLLALVPFLTWKGTPAKQLLRKLVPSLCLGLVTFAIAVASGVTQGFDLLFVFLAGTALAANLHKTYDRAKSAGGLFSAGGYFAHVGVGIMFLGVLSSSAYDFSRKVTLEQNVPQEVGDLTLTFKRYVPRQGDRKEAMEVEVVRDDGYRYMAYPKLFVNDRTKQLMANPHVQSTFLQDFYISPIQYEPGQPPGIDRRLQLAKGQAATAGDIEVTFVDFDLNESGDAMTQLASGQQIAIGATLQINRGQDSQMIRPIYRFGQDGRVETPPIALPGGGFIALTGITPRNGRVQLDLAGIETTPKPARLSIDVTEKPLISLVWYGLYVVLIGGALATINRLQNARKVDEIEAKVSAAKG